MATITDEEFGTITLRRSAKASYVRIRVAPNGRLRASLPLYAPVFLVKRLIASSRSELREILREHQYKVVYAAGQPIGKSHLLTVREQAGRTSSCVRHGRQLIVTLGNAAALHDPPVQHLIRDEVIKALRLEAKSYLPKRLAFLANKHGYTYATVRFSHAGSRWGSCNTSGTISLNIALMKLPFELIDYVLLHELSHTLQMNHSAMFWQLVEQSDPAYVSHRRQLKAHTPAI